MKTSPLKDYKISQIRGGREEVKYKGARKRKWGRWVSEIRLPNSRSRIWLGSYDSPVKAARAFDVAAAYLRGGRARLNFPDSLPYISSSCTLTPQQIQAAAARYANATTEVTLPEIEPPVVSGEEEVDWSFMPPTLESEPSESVLVSWEEKLDWSFMDSMTAVEDGAGFGFPSIGEFYYDFSPRYVMMHEEPEQNQEAQSSFLWSV